MSKKKHLFASHCKALKIGLLQKILFLVNNSFKRYVKCSELLFSLRCVCGQNYLPIVL